MASVSGTPGDDILYGTNDPDMITGDTGNDRLFAFAGDDTLDGGDGSDLLDGGTGADTMSGGTGDDYYYVDNAGDLVIENVGAGSDLVFASVNYALPDNVERLAAYDASTTDSLTLIGNSLNNEIIGNNGADVLDGGSGQDLLRGAGGDDQYIVSLQGNVTIGDSPSGSNLTGLGSQYLNSDAADIVGETSTGGTDTIWVPFTGSESAHTWFDYTLIKGSTFAPGWVEQLGVYDRSSTYAVNLQGDTLNNQIFGNDGANMLDGWTGADVLKGYGGDDSYFVNDRNDSVLESAGGGNDTVYLTRYLGENAGGQNPSSYHLPDNVERLVALDSATYANGLSGNDLANEIVGNARANSLSGGDRGTAVDILRGGGGDDSYDLTFDPIYHTPPAALDLVVELAGGGYDTVNTTSSYTLPDNVEALRGNGVLTGNDLDNAIHGADATNDTLDGGTGADSLAGGGGDDTYYVDNVGDAVTELAGGGTDSVYTEISYTIGSNVERVFANPLTGTQPLDLSGNDGDNEIKGNDGANVIDGKYGTDVLYGLDGADTFAFTTSLFGSGADQLVDFQTGVDKIALDHSVFTALAPGALSADAFTTSSTAQDANDRIIYDSSTGWLSYDRDGTGSSGVPIHFATVHEGMALTAGDFIVV
jgi:Ca2+-binding RTX toxin-like protein